MNRFQRAIGFFDAHLVAASHTFDAPQRYRRSAPWSFSSPSPKRSVTRSTVTATRFSIPFDCENTCSGVSEYSLTIAWARSTAEATSSQSGARYRGIDTTYEGFGDEVRLGDCQAHHSMALGRGAKWHPDEALVRTKGRKYFLWRAVDQHGRGARCAAKPAGRARGETAHAQAAQALRVSVGDRPRTQAAANITANNQRDYQRRAPAEQGA